VRRWIAIAALIALPRIAEAQVPEAPPPRYVHRPRVGLIVGGSFLFGVTWGVTSLVATAQFDCDGPCSLKPSWGLLPVAGPLLLGGTSAQVVTIEVLDAAAQVAGLAMIGIGIAGANVPERPPPRRRYPTRWSLAPSLSPRLGGLSLVGVF
jgi:hypothetical protein